jgi:Bacterial membrane protein YfhO
LLLVLYILTALAVLALVHRFVVPLSRGASAFLFLLPLVFTGYALVAGRVIAPIDKAYLTEPLAAVKAQYGIDGDHNPVTTDVFSQLVPWRHAVREAYGRGEWPLWNPYILCGDILAAAAQPAAYSPFTLIALLVPAAVSFTFTAAITFLLAGAGAFAFARELGCREGSAAIAASGWAFCAPMVLYVLWPLGFAWSLLPLVLLATRRVMRYGSLLNGALLMIVLALLILGGHPQTIIHIVLIAAVYGLFEGRSVKSIATAVAAGAVSIALCAIYLLPFLEAAPQAAEWDLRKMSRPPDSSQQVLVSLATDVFPFLHIREWESMRGVKGETPAAGSIILALALFAVWNVRTKTTWLFAALALLGILAHANWGPVARVLDLLPTINERLAFAAAFFLVMLAAIGAEHLSKRAAVTMAIVLILLSLGTYLITQNVQLGPPPAWGKYKILAELVPLAAAIFVTRWRIALVALILVQRLASDGGVHKSFDAEAAYPPMRLFEAIENTNDRVVGQGWALIPATGALYGLEDARGYEAMTFKPFFQTYSAWCTHQPVFFNRVDDLSKPFLSMINVRYAFTKEGASIPGGWRAIAKEGSAIVLENENVLPRAFVPKSVRIGWQHDITLDQMREETDFARRAWIDASLDAPQEWNNDHGTVSAIRRIRHGYEFDATMRADGWVVITNSAWKGWRAYIDGRRVRHHRANAAFLGVHVPEGQHRVRLVYWPQSFVIGRAISLATLILLIAFAVGRLRFAA